MKQTTITVVVVLLLCIVTFVVCSQKNKGMVEGYRDPLYINRAKFMYDYYPRSNGSIYGFDTQHGGSWNILQGFPYYDNVY